MNKWAAVLLALLVVGALVVVVAGRPTAHNRLEPPPAEPTPAPALASTGAPAATPVRERGGSGGTAAIGDTSTAVAEGGGAPDGAIFDRLVGGQRAPQLPSDAPRQVSFGVVLLQYAGVEGASSGARSREQALRLARELFELAKTDFEAAVTRGDRGSTADAGKMPKGVLEPAPEYVLFSLSKGAVGEPVDTPRGWWIVKRIE